MATVAAVLARQATDVLPPAVTPTETLPTTPAATATVTTTAFRERPTDIPFGYVQEGNRIIPYWYSREGEIVKWSIFLGFTVLFTAFLLGSYMHAQRRLKKGLVPLGYHRWLVSRSAMARVDPRYAYPQATYNTYRPGADYYGMHAMPPPVYDPSAPRPPMYAPPEGATKADPSQWRDEAAQPPPPPPANGTGSNSNFAPPPGPPPALTTNNTGASNNPYRL